MTLVKAECYLCPKCNQPMVERGEAFFWCGMVWPGLVCKICNGLWEDPRNPFIASAARLSQGSRSTMTIVRRLWLFMGLGWAVVQPLNLALGNWKGTVLSAVVILAVLIVATLWLQRYKSSDSRREAK